MYTITIRLRQLLEERGMTQKELAIAAGLRESTVSEIARNVKTGINFDHLSRIAEVLQVKDIRELIVLDIK